MDVEKEQYKQWLQYELDNGTKQIQAAHKAGTVFAFLMGIFGLLVGFLIGNIK